MTLIAGGATLALTALAQSAPGQARQAAQFDSVIHSFYRAGKPGAAVIVARDGRATYRKAVGMADLELNVPIAPDMVFELGSVTKQFTAVAILMLAAEGKLALSDPVTKFLPDYPASGQRVTIEHLLTHTSGIPNYTDLPEWRPLWRRDLQLAELIALFQDKPLEFEPGSRWAYSNSGYILLGAIIERASGQSYARFIEARIFQPAGMAHSYYASPVRVIPRRVSGYVPDSSGFRNAEYLSMTQPYAAGALMSTVDDLVRWENALASGTLLAPEWRDRAYQRYRLSNGTLVNYGYGWEIGDLQGHSVIHHGGGIFGFQTHVLRIPDAGLYVAVLQNCDGEPDPEEVATRLGAIALGKPIHAPRAIQLPVASLEQLVGVYQLADGGTRTITVANDRIYSQRKGGEKLEIHPATADLFFFDSAPTRLVFVRDSTGEATGMIGRANLTTEEFAPRISRTPPTRTAVTLAPVLLDRYVGAYELSPNFVITVRRKGDALEAQATGQGPLDLLAETETRFYLTAIDADIDFTVGSDGTVTGLVLHQGGRDVPGPKIR